MKIPRMPSVDSSKFIYAFFEFLKEILKYLGMSPITLKKFPEGTPEGYPGETPG